MQNLDLSWYPYDYYFASMEHTPEVHYQGYARIIPISSAYLYAKYNTSAS